MNTQNGTDIDLCRRVKDIRLSAGLTQPQFADQLLTTRVSINAIENGRYNPGLGLLRNLKDKYKLSYDYLIDGKEGKQNKV
jgi:transcriptional regulator with XRE-family HTH domain